ncbi:MAG: methylenetetrahydrofolate reductase C-terminal domain-containing protein [Planctomycetes bacterium]|nr:methylenetetrahydrofolate reductase C-terminal domain-containing protein [Planctomycetota bacterium]
MLVTELKPQDEILEGLADDSSVFLLGCDGCASACETGGAENLPALAEMLQQAGKELTGQTAVDYLCNKSLIRSYLRPYEAQIMDADSVLVATCGVGVQCVADSVLKRVRTACNTVNMGGVSGVQMSGERCAECGDCLLSQTGGICPITACSKSMVNGPCGGTSSDGKCEVDNKRDCGWYRIYQRLKELDALDQMKVIIPPKRHGLFLPTYETMTGEFWAVEGRPEGEA